MDPVIPLPHLRATRAFAITAGAALVFLVLALDLHLHGPLTGADVPISHWFAAHAQPWTTQLALAASALHSTVALCVFAAALAGALVLRGQSHWVPFLAAAVPGGLVLNALVKLVFQRPRPVFAHPLVALPTFSFPSGHAVGATVWWGFVVVFWVAADPRLSRRVLACAIAAAMVLLTALARVDLGAHYPTDVVAGIAEGTLWLVLCCVVAGTLARRRTAGGGLA